MSNQSHIAVVTMPVRPNSTISAIATTKGGVINGRMDMARKTDALRRMPPRTASSAKNRPMAVEITPVRLASSSVFQTTPQP